MNKMFASILASLFSASSFASIPPSEGKLYVSPFQKSGALDENTVSSIQDLENQGCVLVDEFADKEGKTILEFNCLDHHTVFIPNGLVHVASSNDIQTGPK